MFCQGELMTCGLNSHHQLGHVGGGLGDHVPEPKVVRALKGDMYVSAHST
jgi:hypothetical protein